MNKENKENIPDIEKDGWKAEELAEEATNKEDDEIVRQMLRGNESNGNADERDVAPALDSNDTSKEDSEDSSNK